VYNRRAQAKWIFQRALKGTLTLLVLLVLIPTGWISEWASILYSKLDRWQPRYPKYTSNPVQQHNREQYDDYIV